MLLGIVLHASTRFIPYYDADNAVARMTLGNTINVLHGFRMPLFFLISGFFTAMLWHKRGALSLLRHRAKRVLLPFVVAVIVILPLTGWGFRTGRLLAGQDPGEPTNYFSALLNVFDLRLAHLWFLWMLWVLVCAFVIAVGVRHLIKRHAPRVATWLSRGHGVFIGAMVVATIVGQYAMVDSPFGPGYTEKILLDPVVLGYYAGFFAVGCAMCLPSGHVHPGFLRITRNWVILTVVSALLVATAIATVGPSLAASRAFQVAFSWVAILALLGLFRVVFSTSRPWVRWLSDASFWLYLMHLPLVAVFQGVVAPWPLPFYVKTVLIFLFTVIPLLVAYQYGVRYTPVGTLLNGKRTRTNKRKPQPSTV